MSGDLACTYAALILSDDGQEVTADKMDSVIKAAGVEIEPYWTMIFSKFLATKPWRSSSPTLAPAVAAAAAAAAAAAVATWRCRGCRARARREEEEEEAGDFDLFD